MTRVEMVNRINELKREDFLINMSDFLTIDERTRIHEISNEIIVLEKELKKMN